MSEVAVALLVVVLVVVLFRLRFCYDIALPPKPAPPTINLASDAVKEEADRTTYASAMADDAKRFALATPFRYREMTEVFAHHRDESGYHLVPGQRDRISAETKAGLALSVTVVGGGRDKMLALVIRNQLPRPVAYKIETKPDQSASTCQRKEDVPHNAVVIPANGVVTRSECSYSRNKGVRVKSVETVEVPELSYYYLSALRPSHLGIAGIATRLHRPPDGVVACASASSGILEEELRRGSKTWQDLVDFYARHDCHKFQFPLEYQAHAVGKSLHLPVGESP